MVSIKDVAKEAGVSITTVSRVMNNRGYIGEATRKKVEAAISSLNYSPNQIARSLLSNQSYLIGLVVPEIKHPFFSEMVHWIEHYAELYNYKIIICNSVNNSEKETKYLKMLKEHRADGVIMCSHTLDTAVYKDISLPIVSFDRIISDDIPYIASDNYRGGELATDHLITQGCKRLLHISGPLNYEMLSNRRKDAFTVTCNRYGVHYDVIEGADIESSFDDYYSFIENELSEKIHHYDGVFCSNDLLAYALVIYAENNNISIPHNLKIVGYDHHSFSRMINNPKLTTIEQPIKILSEQLVNALLNEINFPNVKNNISSLYNVELIKGDTT